MAGGPSERTSALNVFRTLLYNHKYIVGEIGLVYHPSDTCLHYVAT